MTEPSTYPDPIDWHVYGELLSQRVDELGRVTAEPYDPAEWPKHWLAAEGMNEEWLRLKGRTHTIAEFNAERTTKPHIEGILHGRWRTAAGGGPLDGVVGQLSDDTDSLQLFIRPTAPKPASAQTDGARSRSPAHPEREQAPSSLPRTWGDIQDGLSQDEAGRIRFHLRLDAAMQNLHVSIRATAIRPLNPRE